jgi:hypothetical protein
VAHTDPLAVPISIGAPQYGQKRAICDSISLVLDENILTHILDRVQKGGIKKYCEPSRHGGIESLFHWFIE